MKKYLVRFTTKSGDYDKEWCYADSKEEAKKEEEGLLKDRKSILALIEDLYDDCDEPMFRFLSSEEVLDLIIENGRK